MPEAILDLHVLNLYYIQEIQNGFPIYHSAISLGENVDGHP